jgi:hypothetical protein
MTVPLHSSQVQTQGALGRDILGSDGCLTLLWTSQGLVMADRSHAVIIMALQAEQSHTFLLGTI